MDTKHCLYSQAVLSIRFVCDSKTTPNDEPSMPLDLRRGPMKQATSTKDCPDNTPDWFVGHWRDWHRGHGCTQDDGLSRSVEAVAEISQHAYNKSTGYLTDAELAHLRTRTTSGDTLLVRALDELRARRAEVTQRTAEKVKAPDSRSTSIAHPSSWDLDPA